MIGFLFITKGAEMFSSLLQKHINNLKNVRFFRYSFCAFLIILINFTTISSSYATMGGAYGAGRMRSCDSEGNATGGLTFDPFFDGKDMEFVLTNPVCIAVAAATYVTVKTTIASMNGICGSGSPIPRVWPSPIMDVVDVGRATYKAASTQNAVCATAVGIATSSWAVALAAFGIIYAVAEDTYKHTTVCGFGWKSPNPLDYTFSSKGIEAQRNNTIQERLREYQSNPAAFEDNKEKRKLLGLDGVDEADQTYREWYYGGIEVTDQPADFANEERCLDPLRGGKPQRYYLRGTEPGNFNCERYIYRNQPGVTEKEMSKALGCCQKRSKEFICIDFQGSSRSAVQGVISLLSYTADNYLSDLVGTNSEIKVPKQFFCRGGKLCQIYAITFSTKFLENDRLICAESYSLCPYNFTLSGGTEVCEKYQDGVRKDSGYWDIIDPEEVDDGDCQSNSAIRNADCTYNEKAGKCRNYCQYLTHCAYTSSLPYDYKTSIGSPYFSTACLDFQGDSQNKSSYSTLRHFSLPIAQCMKETLENLFYNRAGHSRCTTEGVYPDKTGTCQDGNYAKTVDGYDYKMGGQVEDQSFFERIQDALRDFVRLMLIFAVVFLGAGVLVGKVNLGDKKQLILFITKFSLVIYFSLGTAWHSQFFNGVYNAANEFAMMVFKINGGEAEIRRDGCQFGEITLPDGSVEDTGRNYPDGKEYLAIFDTLDCKVARYLGFGPEVSVANIAKLVLAGYFVGPVGIYFSLCILIFGFFLVALTIRALHIFLSSCLAIILLVIISPLVIPTVMFEKTNNIFKGWLKQLISFTLQPMILFAYIAIFVTILDSTMIGSAVFTGKAPNKKISCSKNCYFKDTGLISLKEDGITGSDCIEQNEEFIDPMNDSVACLINIDDFGSWPGLEWLGISIPIIENIFTGNVKQKILTIIKGVLIMMLLYGFMDEIGGITAQLIGGASLPTAKADPMAMFKKVAGDPKFSLTKGMQVEGGMVNAAERRMTRGSQKLLKKGASMAKGAAQRLGSKGGGEEGGEGGGSSDSGNTSGGDETGQGK